jgi:cytochrome c peroxidase
MPTEANLAGCLNAETVGVPGQPTALAFTAQGQLLVQSREPASLTVLPSASAPGQAGITIDLGGQSVFDTGHELFHRDSGGGIACASCHAEGAEDGHTWLFSDVGKRRTQALHVGLQGTAPFHWNGDLHDIGALMEAVLVGRMGGVHQSDARRDALQRWLFSLRPPTPAVDPGDPSAERGKALFDSGALGCSGCHHGAKFTDNQSYDVGSGRPGERLQVPSLRGVGYRAPFIHTGCAATLRERFDPSCGGARHGNTAQLDAAQLDDLIAYLRSL